MKKYLGLAVILIVGLLAGARPAFGADQTFGGECGAVCQDAYQQCLNNSPSSVTDCYNFAIHQQAAQAITPVTNQGSSPVQPVVVQDKPAPITFNFNVSATCGESSNSAMKGARFIFEYKDSRSASFIIKRESTTDENGKTNFSYTLNNPVPGDQYFLRAGTIPGSSAKPDSASQTSITIPADPATLNPNITLTAHYSPCDIDISNVDPWQFDVGGGSGLAQIVINGSHFSSYQRPLSVAVYLSGPVAKGKPLPANKYFFLSSNNGSWQGGSITQNFIVPVEILSSLPDGFNRAYVTLATDDGVVASNSRDININKVGNVTPPVVPTKRESITLSINVTASCGLDGLLIQGAKVKVVAVNSETNKYPSTDEKTTGPDGQVNFGPETFQVAAGDQIKVMAYRWQNILPDFIAAGQFAGRRNLENTNLAYAIVTFPDKPHDIGTSIPVTVHYPKCPAAVVPQNTTTTLSINAVATCGLDNKPAQGVWIKTTPNINGNSPLSDTFPQQNPQYTNSEGKTTFGPFTFQAKAGNKLQVSASWPNMLPDSLTAGGFGDQVGADTRSTASVRITFPDSPQSIGNNIPVIVHYPKCPATQIQTAPVVASRTINAIDIEVSGPNNKTDFRIADLGTGSTDINLWDAGTYQIKLVASYNDGTSATIRTFSVNYTPSEPPSQLASADSFRANLSGPDSGVVGQPLTFTVTMQSSSDQKVIDGGELDIQKSDNADPQTWGCAGRLSRDNPNDMVCFWIYTDLSGKPASFSQSWTPTVAGTYKVFVNNVSYNNGKSGCTAHPFCSFNGGSSTYGVCSGAKCEGNAIKTVTITSATQPTTQPTTQPSTQPSAAVCTPGKYDVECTGYCGPCGTGSGMGEATVKQCNSTGTAREDRNSECNTKCAQNCASAAPAASRKISAIDIEVSGPNNKTDFRIADLGTGSTDINLWDAGTYQIKLVANYSDGTHDTIRTFFVNYIPPASNPVTSPQAPVPPAITCTPGTPRFVPNSCTGRCRVAGCPDGKGEGEAEYLQSDCQTYANRQGGCVQECGNQCANDPSGININDAPDCDFSQRCQGNGTMFCKGKMLNNQCTYVDLPGYGCGDCVLPVVCTPGIYDVQCTGSCGSCGQGSGAGEAYVKQCNNTGTAWEDRNSECSAKCADKCGSETSAPSDGGLCTYPEACSIGGVHVCHGAYQGGVCKYDPGVNPDCSECQ